MRFKFMIAVSCILFACNFAYGQNASQKPNYGKIGLTFSSLGTNDIDSGDRICDCSNDGDGFYDIGITYIYPINHWLELETGVEYSKQTIRSSSFNPNRPTPHISSTSDFSLVDIPLTVRANFLHYFFANAGFLVDIDASKSSPITDQSGIGQMAGIGAQYNFKNGIVLFVNPYLKYHASIPFSSGDHHQKLYEDGFRFGIMYNL